MRYRVILLVLSTLLLTCGQAFSSGWETGLADAEDLAAAGKVDSAAAVLRETLARALAEYAESDTTVKVELFRDGLAEDFYFRSLEEAESLFVRVLRLKEMISEEEDIELAYLMSHLAKIYRSKRDYAKAGPLYERSLAILEHELGGDHINAAGVLGGLALCEHYGSVDYTAAESLYVRCLAVLDDAFGPDNETQLSLTLNYGLMLMDLGRFADAAAILEHDLTLRRRVYGADSPRNTYSLGYLASAVAKLGRYAEAESLLKRALAINEKEYGQDSYRVTYTLNQMGKIYHAIGRFAEAEAVLRKSLRIRERELGPDAPQVSFPANTLGNVCSAQGRLTEAEAFFKRSIAINEKLGGRARIVLAVGLYNLALAYRDQGEYGKAAGTLGEALSLFEEVYGPDHYDVGGACIELAGVTAAIGRDAEAESLYHRALSIALGAHGPGSNDAARVYQGLGDLYLDRYMYAEAGDFLRKALAIREEEPWLAVEHVPQTLESLVRLNRLMGEYAVSFDLAMRAVEIRRESFTENAHALSERDAIAASRRLRSSIGILLSCYSDLGRGGAERSEETANVLFSCKGQVSDGIFERRRSLVDENDPALHDLAERLRVTRFRLSQLFVAGSVEDLEAYSAEVDSVSRLAADLEADLARESASYKDRRESREISLPRLALLIPEGTALVEYIRYDYEELQPKVRTPIYLAMILSKSGGPVITNIGQAAEIDALIDQYRGHMIGVASSGRVPSIVDQQEYDRLSSKIYDRIWRPVEQDLGGGDLVLIAPDGALSMIAFAGLKAPDGQYLIEKHALHYLSAGRDLVRLEYEPEPAVGLFALGDPDYGAAAAERIAALEVPGSGASGDSVIQVAFATRNVRSGCGRLGEMEVSRLPGTRREVELVSDRWAETTLEPLVACYGEEASEEYFKAEAPGKRVIHLATHGYFLGGACRPEVAGAEYVGENPLLLSGLFLAGSNLHGLAADSLGAEDGILTAYEVSAMDLEGTELVVLSACETGLGEVSEGEGVYGLRRAFQMAGARTVVSALWPVSDEATAEMMGELYGRSDESLPEAMRRIQIERIKELRSGGQVEHPFPWGAFIAMGDWR